MSKEMLFFMPVALSFGIGALDHTRAVMDSHAAQIIAGFESVLQP
ncbi:hypothetical protein [Pseudooceanicola sp. MF1-13]